MGYGPLFPSSTLVAGPRFANEKVYDGQVPRDHSEVWPQAQAQFPAVRLQTIDDLEHPHSVFACFVKRGLGGQLKQTRKLLIGLGEAGVEWHGCLASFTPVEDRGTSTRGGENSRCRH